MIANRFLRYLLQLMVVSFVSPAAVCAAQPEQWFAPTQFGPQSPDPAQFLELAKDPAAWSQSRIQINVFKVYLAFVDKLPDDTLRTIFAYLNQSHLALALESPMLKFDEQEHCGWGIEGYGPRLVFRHIAERIRNLGGNLAYIAMDEPLFYGHDFVATDGRQACRRRIEDIAADVAENIAEFRTIFPNIIVGDIEPVGSLREGDRKGELRHWFSAYKAATGLPIAFLHDDVLFDITLDAAQMDAYQVTREAHIPMGFIYNGSPAAQSDRAWMQSAFTRAQKLHAFPTDVEHVVIQSWDLFPKKFLPETSDTALTNLISYVNSRESYKKPPIDLICLVSPEDQSHRIVTANLQEVQQLSDLGWLKICADLVFPEEDSRRQLVPVYRLEQPATGDQLLTTSSNERLSALQSGFQDVGILGFAYSAQDQAGHELWRALNVKRNRHFFTFFPKEAKALPKDTFRLEGVVARFPIY